MFNQLQVNDLNLTKGNYYPVNSHITIQDIKTNASMSLINDRPQGGSSLQPGTVELMINRKVSSDDGRGTSSVLNYDINL